MRLKVTKVTRDEDGLIVSEEKPGKQAIVDMTAESTEFADMQNVEIDGFLWDKTEGIFMIYFSVGSYDSLGVFHPNPEFPRVVEKWGRVSTPQVWIDYNLDNLINTSMLDQVKTWLYNRSTLTHAGRRQWGFDNLETQVTDDSNNVVQDYKKGSQHA